jgi:hypothetical protein
MKTLKEHTREKYETTLGYISTLKLPYEFSCIDLGWSGTIQDNLTDILGEEFIPSGRYFAMRPHLSDSSEKRGFVNANESSLAYQKVMRSLRPIEMLFNSKIGSTVAYKAGASEVKAIRSEVLDSFPQSFEGRQELVLSRLDDASVYIKDNLLTLSECAQFGLSGLSEFVSKPEKIILKDYLESIHDETYGLGDYVFPGSAKLSIRHIRDILLGDASRIKEVYWQVGWPEALAKRTLGFVPGPRTLRLISKIIWSRTGH